MGADQGRSIDRSDDDRVDEASEESFPASDPPGYRGGNVGGPAMEPKERERLDS